jgi:drug/metabolite transporter (DMT)-like permease
MILGGLPLFALSGLWESEQWTNIDSYGWMALGYSTVFGSAIAYGLFFYFASSGSLTSLSSLTFLTPVFALLFGSIFLAEVLSPLQWTGVALTLVSIYLINQRDALAQKWRSRSQPEAVSLSAATSELRQLEASERQLAQLPLKITESSEEILPNR